MSTKRRSLGNVNEEVDGPFEKGVFPSRGKSKDEYTVEESLCDGSGGILFRGLSRSHYSGLYIYIYIIHIILYIDTESKGVGMLRFSLFDF